MVYAIIAIVIALAVVLATAHPENQNQKPPGFSDLQVPTASEGGSIPVLFGTRDISGPNVVWFGDYRTVPVKQ